MSIIQHDRIGRVAAVLALALALGLGFWADRKTPQGKAEKETVVDAMATMSLEEKVGQMVLAGFPGTSITEEVKELVGIQHLGGVMLSSRNIEDFTQTARLVARLQGFAISNGARIPLFVAADQEGGYVVRLRGASRFPGNMALGAAGSRDLTQRVAEAMGRELLSVGINMDFAPVLDVNSNPANPVIGIRSFGEDPELVAKLGIAFITGLHEAGLAATAKHFPGHGDTSQDSHIALPSVPHSRERLDQVELLPFRRAMESGIDAIMTAHVTFPAVDPEPGMPATLSKPVLTGLLRDEFEYNGLIITDALEMKAITSNFGLEEAAVKAVLAGADMVLVAWPADWRDAVRVVTALVDAANDGRIPMERVDASVKRILETKKRLGLVLGNPPQVDLLSEADQESLTAVSKEAAERSITVVRDTNKRIPLRASDRVLVVAPAVTPVTGAEDAPGETPAVLAGALQEVLGTVDEVTIPTKPNSAIRQEIVDKAADYDTVVMATYYAWSSSYKGQGELVQELRESGKEPIVLALREPYDLQRFPDISTYLAVFSSNTESLTAAARVLTGQIKATGRLPVSLPNLHPVGTGIQTSVKPAS